MIPGLQPPPMVMQNTVQPKAVQKSTGHLYVVVRDDVAANGKLYIAPVGMLTSMRSIRPEEFKEQFEWYLPPSERPTPARVIAANDTQQQPLTAEKAQETWPEGPLGDAIPEEVPASAPAPTPPPPPQPSPDGTPVIQEQTPPAPVKVPKKRGRPLGSKNQKKPRKRVVKATATE